MPVRLEIEPFDYDDVMLVPEKCEVSSRSQVDVSVEIGGRNFKLPVVPANMSTITDSLLAEKLAKEGYFYVMHRFDVDPVEFTQRMQKELGLYSSISVGIKEADYQDVARLQEAGLSPEYITIDIAHGHAPSVINMVKHLRKNLPDSFIIAGNIGTREAALELAKAGADAVKVGIGPGLACLSSPNTGFGTRNWQLSAVAQVAEALQEHERFKKIVVIADGGIRNYGDIAKSIAFGASLVMVGGFLGGHDENPGVVIEDEEGNQFKEFFGSASEYQKGESKHVEGKRLLVPYKGSIDITLRTITDNLQSSISYAGGKELFDLRDTRYVLLKK